MVVQDLGMQDAKNVSTPGLKPPSASKDDAETKTGKELLSANTATHFRSVAARMNFLAIDRADIQYATKNACAKMANPDSDAMVSLKRAGRYLKESPRAVHYYPFTRGRLHLNAYADSDWASSVTHMKSTSGGAIMCGPCTIKTWSSTQNVVALSSAQAELYALVKAATQVLGVMSMAQDLAMPADATVHTDSSSALSICFRRGLGGKTRHIRVRHLWLQEAVATKYFQIKKILGTNNPADLMTKHASQDEIRRHCKTLGIGFEAGRPQVAAKVKRGGGTDSVLIDRAPQ